MENTIKLYHGSPALFKRPYTYNVVYGLPQAGVGFHCCNFEEDARRYTESGPLMYLYEYDFTPRMPLPSYMDKALLTEFLLAVRKIGLDETPSKFCNITRWEECVLLADVEYWVKEKIWTPIMLYMVADWCSDVSFVCRALTSMGYSHYMSLIPDERGGHYNFMIFDTRDLKVSKIIQINNRGKGFELDITESALKQLIM